MKFTAELIIKYRWIIIFTFLSISFFFALQLPDAEIDPEMKNMLPSDMPSRINTDKIEDIFGGTDMIMVLIKSDDILQPETLKRVKKISKKMNRIKGIDKVLSLFELKHIKGEEGAMIVNPAVKRIPDTDEQREILREEIKSNDMVYGNVVSEDFTITAIIGVMETGYPDHAVVPDVKELVSSLPGEEEIFIGGMPYTRVVVAKSIQGDIRKLLPVGLIIMLIFLYFCFRQLRGVLLPFFVVILAIIFSMGLIPMLGWKIQIITILLPVILIAVANDYGIHLIAKYQEDNFPGNEFTKKDIAKRMFSSLGKPILLTGLTSMAGMLCLLGHFVIPARQLGILAGLGIVFALAASLFFIPAIISLLPKTKPVILTENKSNKKPILERLLNHFSTTVSKKPKKVIIGSIIFALITAIGIFSVVIDADPINYFDEDHPIVQVSNLINDHLGGVQNIAIAFEGDIKDPNLVQDIDNIEKKIENMPEIGKTTSIARVVRQMSRALNDPGEQWYDRIPDTRNAIAQYFELYSMSGDPEDFEKMIDFNYEHALINARIKTMSTPKLSKLVNQIEGMLQNDGNIKWIGGFGLIFSELARLVIYGQLLSLFLAIIIVACLLMILFRSVTAGFISIIPIVIGMMILFGLMGLLGIELNVATAMLSSIMIGVGIDYTIHFLWRYKEERQHGLKYIDAVNKTLLTTGRGIVFNAFSVIIGFIVLTLSSFQPVKFFGFLVVVSILACLIGALVLIPALCIVVKPKFLEPK